MTRTGLGRCGSLPGLGSWPWPLLHLREQYPRWGKDKLGVLLRQHGRQVSTSTVGRILARLKARGVLKEPPRTGISTRKRLWRRPYAIRKPKGYPVQGPEDLVQVDTLDQELLAWELTYNTIRPNQALAYLTPQQFVTQWQRQRKEAMCH